MYLCGWYYFVVGLVVGVVDVYVFDEMYGYVCMLEVLYEW